MNITIEDDQFDALPGIDLAREGLADLRSGKESAEALLVMAGASRLRRCGVAVPDFPSPVPNAELQLYRFLEASDLPDPYSLYNSLLRRFVSFESSLERLRGAAIH